MHKNLEVQYYRRYTLQSLLALQAIDDDGNLAVKPKNVKPKLLNNTVQFKNAQEAMSERGKTVNDIKQHYIISKEIEEKLLKFKIYE